VRLRFARGCIIGLTGAKVRGVDDPLAERVDFVRNPAGGRFDPLELNLAITAVPAEGSRIPDLSMTRSYTSGFSDEELLSMPSALTGFPREMADTLSGYREKYGVMSFTVQDKHLDNFAKVIVELR
jgi:hypothetical protein